LFGKLGNVRVGEELPVGEAEEASGVGCEVDVNYLLAGLSSVSGVG